MLEAWDIYSNDAILDSAEQLINRIIIRLEGKSVSQPATNLDANVNPAQICDNTSSKLGKQLIDLSRLPPQKRGYEFEHFLKELFDAYGLSARASFRQVGEQIDGSFILNNETYLLEAKWQNTPTGASDLHTFEGKLSQKASWSRGVFISNSGFTPDGLTAFGKGKRIICMDGLDLSEMIRLKLSIIEVLEAKIRSATETGQPYIPIRELFS